MSVQNNGALPIGNLSANLGAEMKRLLIYKGSLRQLDIYSLQCPSIVWILRHREDSRVQAVSCKVRVSLRQAVRKKMTKG